MQGISSQYVGIKILHFLLGIFLKNKTKAVNNENMLKLLGMDSNSITESLRQQLILALKLVFFKSYFIILFLNYTP